jgi:hypothetical protein
MPALRVLISPEAVDAYVDEHDLAEGSVELEAMALQRGGMVSGAPAVLISFVLDDGTRVVGKTSLQLLDMAASAFRGALEGEADRRRRGN